MDFHYILNPPRIPIRSFTFKFIQSQLNLLSKFHVDTLKRIQSLPTRTATCTIHLLLGALPIEAEIHKRQLSMLYILASTNETITELTERQIAVNLDNSLNYFNKVHNVLFKYQLPFLNELRIKQPTKESWKSTVILRSCKQILDRITEE